MEGRKMETMVLEIDWRGCMICFDSDCDTP